MGNNIYDKKMEIVRTVPKLANLGGKDPDHVVELCNEVSFFFFFLMPSETSISYAFNLMYVGHKIL